MLNYRDAIFVLHSRVSFVLKLSSSICIECNKWRRILKMIILKEVWIWLRFQSLRLELFILHRRASWMSLTYLSCIRLCRWFFILDMLSKYMTIEWIISLAHALTALTTFNDDVILGQDSLVVFLGWDVASTVRIKLSSIRQTEIRAASLIDG